MQSKQPKECFPEVNPLEYDSEIVIAGSSTVFPLAERMLERWEDEGGPASTYDSIGSGGGFERFCVVWRIGYLPVPAAPSRTAKLKAVRRSAVSLLSSVSVRTHLQ